jgi:transglutaminase-like putative cysteine protease
MADVPEVDYGLAGETWPITSFIQTYIPSMINLARTIKGETDKEVAQGVLDFIAKNVKYPVNPDGRISTARSTYIFQITGPFYRYKHEARYGWLLPNQSLRVRSGICYDTSVLATSLLRIRGISAYTAIGILQKKGKTVARHAWCVARLKDGNYLLETTVSGGTELIKLELAYHGLGSVTYIEFIGFDEAHYWEKTEELTKYGPSFESLRGSRPPS